MEKIIHYISFYSDLNDKENRYNSLACVNKVNYIMKVLNKLDYQVKIISPTYTLNNCYYSEKDITICKKNKLHVFATKSSNNKIIRYIERKLTFLVFKKYLLKNIKENEQIIVYHANTMLFYNVLKKLKKKKNIKIILEVEEIYSDVNNSLTYKKEEKMFKLADKYIFVTKMLEQKINNIANKPYCISHGNYNIENKIVDKYNDGKIHIVYSGIIDFVKKGAQMALNIAQYLSDKYVVHIIGFGNQNDIEILKEKIKENNSKNKCIVIYDGIRKGKEYISYIQKCEIGLSTQDSDEKYNDTSFPSKILAYLSNGLRVVSINIPAIKNSNVSELIYFYNENNPESAARVIMGININEKYESRSLIKKLDKEFTEKMAVMLND